jgi:two-component system, chemotaxis family, chemotaxis protein CheY
VTRKKTVLIVDDSATVRGIIRLFMEQQKGIAICGEAVDGLDAIAKARELKPDLILLDLAMPRMNGAEAAAVLKSESPQRPIILFTMYSEAVGKSLMNAIGVDMVLSKPDGMAKLADHVAFLLKTSPEEPLESQSAAETTRSGH